MGIDEEIERPGRAVRICLVPVVDYLKRLKFISFSPIRKYSSKRCSFHQQQTALN